ncbi:MAG: hypothetical protein PVJ42_07190 [bacterium]
MPGKLLALCCAFAITAVVVHPIACRSAEIIDVSVAGQDDISQYYFYALDDEGGLYRAYALNWNWVCCLGTYAGAVGMDFGVQCVGMQIRGFITFTNGDLLPVDFDGTPGPIIPGPEGVSGIEEISVRFGCTYYGADYEYLVQIRSGCTTWCYIEDGNFSEWFGPFDIGSLPSLTQPGSWGQIKTQVIR